MKTIWKFLKILLGLPGDVVRSVLGKTAEGAYPHPLTDRLRARLIAAADALALLCSAAVYFFLRAYFTSAAKDRLGIAAAAGVALMIMGFVVGMDLLKDLKSAIDGDSDSLPAQRPLNSPKAIRVLVLGNLAVFGFVIHVTGGPLISPFSPFALGVIVLGLFLASTRETRRTLVVLGIAFHAILTWIAISPADFNRYFINGVYPVHESGPKQAYVIVTAVTILIGGIANRNLAVRRQDQPVAGSGRGENPAP